MLPLVEECWTRLSAPLRERAGAAAYDAWLAELRPVLLERGVSTSRRRAGWSPTGSGRCSAHCSKSCSSAEFGTRLSIELQANEAPRFDALEVSPQQPIVDDGNRTAFLVLKHLGSERQLPSNLFLSTVRAGSASRSCCAGGGRTSSNGRASTRRCGSTCRRC
jgi:hypothetical protein